MKNRPLVANWMLTGTCNMTCDFCYGHFSNEKISFAQKCSIIDILSDAEIPKLTITGGEPLLDKDIIPLLEYATNKGIFISLHTNGLLLNETTFLKLRGVVNRISLPLDGSDNSVNLLMRKKNGYFNHIIRLFSLFEKYSFNYSVKTVASKKNLADLERLSQVLRQYNPEVWLITQFRAIERGRHFSEEFSITTNEFNHIKQKLSGSLPNICFFSNDDSQKHAHFFIDLLGNVYTNSHHENIKIGSIFAKSIEDLWRNIININSLDVSYYEHSRIKADQ